MSNKRERMMHFWSERAKIYGDDPKANTNDIWLRDLEVRYVADIIRFYSPKKAMDFGCANGYSTIRLANLNKETRFLGVDINHLMINIAKNSIKKKKIPNLEFREIDILNDVVTEKYDLIFSIRAFQNIESFEMQKKVFNELHELIADNGILLFIEFYADGYERLNADRLKLGLECLPIHNHLTLLKEEFDEYVSQKMTFLKREFISSSYYLITRLAYSYFAKISNEPIDYNHPLHEISALVPQIGEYGPERALLFRK